MENHANCITDTYRKQMEFFWWVKSEPHISAKQFALISKTTCKFKPVENVWSILLLLRICMYLFHAILVSWHTLLNMNR